MTIPESIPEDKELSYPCNNCGGSVTLNPNKDWWECDECDFAVNVGLDK